MICLFITESEKLLLRLKAFALINRVVKLRISVCHLPAVHKELKTLNIVGIFRLLFGERRYFNGMIHNKRRLNKVFLNKSLEEEIEYIALFVVRLKLNIVLLCGGSCLVKSLYLIKIDTRILLYRVKHSKTLKGLAEIHFNAVICYNGSAENLFCNMAIKIFGKIHHTVIIRICLIKLHKSKFGIVACVKTLITENSAYFIHSFESADYKAFQIQLKRNSELNVLVESIVMSDKRPCRRAARVCNEHGGFNLHKAL